MTYKDVKVKDKTINFKYVKDWFNRNMEKATQPKGSNSFVVTYIETTITLGMLCIDVFTKET